MPSPSIHDAQAPPAAAKATGSSLRKGPIPLYVQLADVLRRRAIERYRAGERFPTVQQLATEFAVAQVTVRQAQALLEKEGLLERARGRGTIVLEPPAPPSRFHLSTSLEELVASTRHTEPRILATALAMPPAELVPTVGMLAPKYRFMHRVHAIGGDPYAVLRLYVDERLYRSLPASRFANETVVCALKRLQPSPIHSGRQHVTVQRVAADDATWLGIPHDAPVARIRRHFLNSRGTLIYLGDIVYRGDFVSWDMDLDV